MKKLLTLLFMTIFVLNISAQQKDVTTFLGIPIDGSRSEMRQKIIAKGFKPKMQGDTEYFEGEFNGSDVHLFIVTNNNKVYRIMVADVNEINEASIKTRFNILVNQFENNDRYVAIDENQEIAEDVNISYEMNVHNKNFDAVFYQKPDLDNIDQESLIAYTSERLLKKFTQEEIANQTEEVNNEIHNISTDYFIDLFTKKSVWFRIIENYGKFHIIMFYDNEYNKAHGEDL